MASAKFKMPEEFLSKLAKLGDKTEEIIEKTLEAGAEVVEDKVRSNLQAAIGKNTKIESRSTGELAAALGVSPVKVDKNGNYDIKIGFKEPRKDGGSNAKLANILEYGKSGQAAKPFLKPAAVATKKACIETMVQTLEKEIDNV